jgi:superfamily II DNA/RNA helicase
MSIFKKTNPNEKVCPYCRKPFTKDNITMIKKEKSQKKEQIEVKSDRTDITTLNKNEILKMVVKEIIKNKKARILIFSKYARSIDKLEDVICSLGVGCSIINGSGSHVENLKTSFIKGEIPILLMDAQNYGSGLNLQETTHVIIYHRFSKDLETQVIGRGHRYGRTTPLKIIYLTNETENHNIYFGTKSTQIRYKDEIENIDTLHLDPFEPDLVPINYNYFKSYIEDPPIKIDNKNYFKDMVKEKKIKKDKKKTIKKLK